MVLVSSSWLNAINYNGTTLVITFNDDSVFEYQGVPQATYESFLKAPSKGKFFRQNIEFKYTGNEV